MNPTTGELDCGDFARLLYEHWARCPRSMNLLSENSATLPDGIIGVSLELGPSDLPNKTSEALVKLVEPFMITCSGDQAFNFNLLSEVKYPLGIYCHFHGHLKGEKVTKFQLQAIRKPESSTPVEMQRQSKTLGGYPNGFFETLRALGKPTVNCPAVLRGYIFNQKRNRLKFAFGRLKKFGSPLIFERENIVFKHPDGGEIELTFLGKGSPLYFKISSKISVLLDFNCLESACDQLWPILQPVFNQDADPQPTPKPAAP